MNKAQVQKSPSTHTGKESTPGSRTRASKNISQQQPIPNTSPFQTTTAFNIPTPAHLVHLQRTLGNQAVGRILQAKLTISQPDDPYEREADQVADKVMRMPEPETPGEEETQIQTKPLAGQITPLVHRMPEPMAEEEQPPVQAKHNVGAGHDEETTVAAKPLIQRVPLAVREDDDEEKVAPKLETGEELQQEKEEKPVQAKPANESFIHRQATEDEEKEETLPAAPMIHREMDEEKEEQIQAKLFPGSVFKAPTVHPSLARSTSPTVQRLCTECAEEMHQDEGKPGMVQRKQARYQLHDDNDEEEPRVQPKGARMPTPHVTPVVASNIHALNHGGSPLPKATRAFFEPRFGMDLSQVRVHTGSQAAETAKSINARAFTVGNNIAFGGGQYAPESSEGRRLLAHELTHTVQQTGEQVQRDSLGTVSQPSPGDPFGLLAPKNDQLRFTNRSFPKLSLPTVCPSCHDKKPIGPQRPQFVDRDATETRLVEWGKDSELMLHHGGSIRILQLDPNATDTLVDDYGVGLTKRITSSHEFEGPDAAREKGANIIRDHWGDIRSSVRERLSNWYREQLFEAVALTPKWASPVLNPNVLRTSLASHYGERAPLGRLGAEAVPGQKYGIFEIDDIGLGQIWFHLPGRPLWRYQISRGDFIRHDPFIAAVAEQVYDKTKWILQALPLIMKVGAFALGFSGSVAVVIAGIVLDELATEMQADAEGRPGRSVEDILGSGATQLIIDRIFHGLLGGGAGKAAAGIGKSAARIEKIAEKAVPAIRRELAQAEKPLVKQALESGTARHVTDEALKAEGHMIEVAVEAAGESHIFRLNSKGTWCRFTTPICGLDLGADIAAAVKSPSSFTKAKLEDTRALIGSVQEEISFLGRMYERMRGAGKVDMALLSKEERALLDQLAPSGDAAKLSLRELRDLPAKLGLKRDVAVALDQEAKLIQQLYREGRPLYEIMRAASPSSAARSSVLKGSFGRDAVTGIVARSGELHVDHVVPLNDIVRMNGFDKLRPERQLEIVNDVKNLRAIDSLANSSRGDRSWWSWPQAQIYYGSDQIAKMRALEDSLRIYIEGRIRTLLRP